MKKFGVVFFVVISCVSMALFAQEVPVQEVPSWMNSLIEFVMGIPVVGPIVVEVFKYAGLVAAIMTALSACLMSISLALQKASKFVGLVAFAEKVKAIEIKVLPWMKYLSMFNVQKKA